MYKKVNKPTPYHRSVAMALDRLYICSQIKQTFKTLWTMFAKTQQTYTALRT